MTSRSIADHLVGALVQGGVGIADRDRAARILASEIAPLVKAASLFAGITIPPGVNLASELGIDVALSPAETAAMAAMHDARAAAGTPIPGPRPGPLNQPTHDLSDERITLGTLVDLAQALADLGGAAAKGDPDDRAG